jgi:hypothetical protein
MSHKHIINSCAPFLLSVHCVAQRANLAVSNFAIVVQLVKLNVNISSWPPFEL